MATVLRIDGCRFVIWPNDHAPPYVHVFSADAEATIDLGATSGFPRLIQSRRMKKADVAKTLKAVFDHRSTLLRKWSELHG
jgi:hypothetical protein